MFRRFFSVSSVSLTKRPTEWSLPNLDKLPGGFRGKVYNKKDWTKYLEKNTDIIEKEEQSKPHQYITAPPKNWRKMKDLPEYMRNKYALKEKAMSIDLSKIKRLSRSAMDGIRTLHNKYPQELNTEKLSQFFKISPVTISKILKSKWKPSEKELEKKKAKWEERGQMLVERRIIDQKMQDFFETKESELKMEIPYFVKQEVSDYIRLHGLEELEETFEKLNEARVQKQNLKEGDE
ncbi:hypothetical protein FOA43_004714 [Brettanomyces nanus]|uniref:Required for respiratory growth protein 9, mitochondrial n=1 Tax=Eeniella nana TaxID=13502 RepID=A0A875S7H4_EENNA|nr:uncharacterized protein FOA43_004714 [Brettanomyces nanus]QPG77306.1 hypothetical protein FOA43_004714 [Brettanomyces nanus]